MNFRLLEMLAVRSGRNNFAFGILLVASVFLVSCSPATMDAMSGKGADGAPGTSGFIFGTMYFILMAFFAYFFLVIKPQQVEEDERKKYVSELKKGADVTTTGGLMGKVVQVKDDVVTIEIAPKINVQVAANYIEKKSEKNKSS
jgi:preprotein translocase subunit YajC